MNTKKPSLGAGRQMSRLVAKANPLPSIPTAPEITNHVTSSETSKSVKSYIHAPAEVPVWTHVRGIFEGRKETTTTETLRGVTHSGYDFKDLEWNQPVYLIPDPYGQTVKPEIGHDDPTAISVQDNFINGKHIGYLSKTVAATITKYLNKGYQYEAEVLAVKGGYPGFSGEILNYGVDIVIRFYAPLEP